MTLSKGIDTNTTARANDTTDSLFENFFEVEFNAPYPQQKDVILCCKILKIFNIMFRLVPVIGDFATKRLVIALEGIISLVTTNEIGVTKLIKI